MNTIQQQWDMFEDLVVPKGAPAVQRREMRLAFYAGAEAMMRIQFAIGDPKISEEAGVQILEGCRAEMHLFAEEVSEGS